MKFIDVELKNIWAIGNTPITIDLCASPTTLIGGHNGAGKSSFLQGVCYGLFGKLLSKVKLQSAINDTNKRGMLVKVRFEKNGSLYKVIRGEKPKVFEIYKDDELVNQNASSREYQKMLEVVLGMDFKTFSQIVALNKERYVPFLEMTPEQRRGVVDDLLGTMLYSVMDELCRKDITTFKSDYNRLSRDVDVSTATVSGLRDSLNILEQKNTEYRDNISSKIAAIDEEIAALASENENASARIDGTINQRVIENNAQISEYQKLADEFERTSKESDKTTQFFTQNSHCPTCTQPISKEFVEGVLSGEKEKIDNISEAATILATELSSLLDIKRGLDEILAANEKERLHIRSNESKMSTLSNTKRGFERDLSSISSADVEKAELTLEDEQAKLNELIARRDEMAKQLDILEYVRTATSDGGIKQHIIKEYIPVLNQKLNDFLAAMDFYVGIELDENFNETFGAFNKGGFVYEQLSTGQKCRVNLAIWLALLEVSAIKNRVTTNFLVLDEILEPMDTEGVSLFMKLCSEKLPDRNIFVITQRFEEFSEMFSSSIRFKLVNDFTEIESQM